MKRYLAITKALADANRVRLLCALRTGELCVCQLIDLLKLAPSTVSKHLSILHQADLIESRKEGRWVYYRLADKNAPELAVRLIKETFHALRDDSTIQDDAKRLNAIKKTDLEEICQRLLSRN